MNNKTPEQIFMEVKKEIINNVNDKCLDVNGDLIADAVWIEDIEFALNEGRNYFEIEGALTTSKLPHIIQF